MGFLSKEEVEAIGFSRVGRNVLISSKCSIYNPGRIAIGSNSRVDDFCILSAGYGGIEIGRHVHIGAYTSLLGSAPIVLEDFSGLSLHCAVFSSTDDFAATGLINPTVPEEFRNLVDSGVRLERFSTIGSQSVLLPSANLGEGVTVGVHSMVNRKLDAWGLYAGCPARKIRDRPKGEIEAYAARVLARLEDE